MNDEKEEPRILITVDKEKLKEQLMSIVGTCHICDLHNQHCNKNPCGYGLSDEIVTEIIKNCIEVEETKNRTTGGTKKMNEETFIINWITDEEIHFTNGKSITFDHEQDCCEYNYADFEQVDNTSLEYEFTEPLQFENVEGYGFRFGNEGKMVSVPCYSEQNGYYDDTVDIYYDGEEVLLNCGGDVKLDC